MAGRVKLLMPLLCAALLVSWSAPAVADALSEQQKAQRKLLAYRAARADGIRKLAERVQGLQITSETYVRDFVTESDEVATSLNAWLRGMREVGKPKYYEDGTCEVKMEVTLRQVIATLKMIHDRYYKGDKVKATDITQMQARNKITVVSVTGQGAMPDEFAEEPGLEPPPDGTSVFSKLKGPGREYWLAHCTGRGRLMAERAAELDAFRRLAERIKGVHITSETTVRDFVAESDEIETGLNTFLRGARTIRVRYHADELIVEVEKQVKLRTVLATLKSLHQAHYKGDRVKIKQIDELIIKSKDTIIKEVGMGVPPAKYLKDVTVVEQRVLAVASRAPAWISQSLRATGQAAVDTETANKAQAKLMALRAAELDARRKLAEQIDGLMITSNTSVRDFVAENDEIRTSMLTYQVGAKVIESSKKISEDGTAECVVEIDLKPLWNMVLYYQKKLSITIR